MNRKLETPIVLLCLVSVFIILISFLHPRLPIAGDAVTYISLAESLADFKGYAISGVVHTKWPPVFPFMLAFPVFIFGKSIVAIKLLVMVVACFSLYVSYVLLSNIKERYLALWSIIIAGFSFPFIYHAAGIYSDMPYMLFSIWALILLDKCAISERVLTLEIVGASILVFLATLTRSIGVTLFIAGIIYLFVPKKRAFNIKVNAKKAMLFSLLVLVPLGLWCFRNTLASEQGVAQKYLIDFTTKEPFAANAEGAGVIGIAKRIINNFLSYLKIFAIPDKSLRFASGVNIKAIITSIIFSLCWMISYLWQALRRRSILEYYIFIYFCVLLLFNWYDIRYLVPILPFIMYYFLWAARRTIPKKLFVAAACLMLIFNLAFSTVSGKAHKLRSREHTGASKEYYEAAMWLKNNHKDAAIMCSQSQIVRFWTNQKTAPFPFSTDDREIMKVIDKNSIDFVIADSFQFAGKTEKFLKPAIQKNDERFKKIKQFGDTVVYQVVE